MGAVPEVKDGESFTRRALPVCALPECAYTQPHRHGSILKEHDIHLAVKYRKHCHLNQRNSGALAHSKEICNQVELDRDFLKIHVYVMSALELLQIVPMEIT